MAVKNRRAKTSQAAAPDTGPLSAGEVLSILVKARVLKRGDKPPDPDAGEVVRLGTALNLIRDVNIRAQAGAKAAKKATQRDRTLKRYQEVAASRYADQERLQELLTSLSRSEVLMREFEAAKRAWPVIEDWRHLAAATADAFRLAMATLNPGKTYGAAPGGPLLRFLKEALPRITGEKWVGAVGKYLSRNAKKGRPGAPDGLVLLTIEEDAAAADEQDKSG